MKSIKESIIGRKNSFNSLSFLRSLPGDDRFSEHKIYKVMNKLFHHDGDIITKDLNSPTGFKKIYRNPSKAIQDLGDWCAPKNIFVGDCEIFGDDLGLNKEFKFEFICIEYVFQGGDEPFDYDGLASVISDGLSQIPGYDKTPIIILPHVRGRINSDVSLYIVNPHKPKDPICLNDTIGNNKTQNIIKYYYNTWYL